MTSPLHAYLCSRCGHIFEAPADSVDRTREVRGPCCTNPQPWPDDDIAERLRSITT